MAGDRGAVTGAERGERVRPQSMAQTVSDLEGDGLVQRTPDPADGRRALVSLEEDLSAEEKAVLRDAVELLRRLAEN